MIKQVWFLVFGSILSALLLFRCNVELENRLDEVYCDAETVEDEDSKTYFVGQNRMFGNGQTQSDEMAFAGKYSCKLTPANRSGMAYTDEYVNIGDVFEVSVWRFGDSTSSVLCANGDWGFYQDTKMSSEKRNGWDLLKLKVMVTGKAENGRISFYPWLPEEDDSVYFDDFSVKKITDKNWPEPVIPSGVELLELKMKSADLDKIKTKRKQALIKGVLITDKSDWVPAKIDYNTNSYSVNLRLKGDWPDHLEGLKWSYRIKLKKKDRWKGMRTFSLHRPATRYFLHEWVFHKLLERENIIAPRYGFVFLQLNGKSRGLYAYEEHFKNELLDFYNRQEGPIMKFDEDQMWKIRSENNLKDVPNLPVIEACEIQSFTKAEPGQIERAAQLMHNYKFELAPVGEIFDVELLAKYYALMDLARAHHSIIWHNQRFYYNPSSSKLEPVGFDGFHEPEIPLDPRQLLCLSNSRMVQPLFNDTGFFELYLNYLRQYSDSQYVKSFLTANWDALRKYEGYIQIEHPDYNYNNGFLSVNAAFIRKQLARFDSGEQARFIYQKQKISVLPAYEFNDGNPVDGISIIARKSEVANGFMNLRLYSYYHKALVIIGVGKKKMTKEFDKEINLPAYRCCGPATQINVEKVSSEKYVFLKIKDVDSLFKAKISNLY